jgi:hypothetical protein
LASRRAARLLAILLVGIWTGALACNLPLLSEAQATPSPTQSQLPATPASARTTVTPANATATASLALTRTPIPPVPTSPPSPTSTSASLDRGDWQSVVETLLQGIQDADLVKLRALIPPDGLIYAVYIEGGQRKTSAQVLDDFNARLPGSLTCQGLLHDADSLQVWISGWEPAWVIDEICYVECATQQPPLTSQEVGFLFFQSGGEWQLNALYLNTPDRYYFVENPKLDSCPSFKPE